LDASDLTETAVEVRGLCVSFGGRQALREVVCDLPARSITVVIGRSGSGKTTLLRALNRLNECFPGCETRGDVHLRLRNGWVPAYGPGAPPLEELRRRVGMVFALPLPLPGTIRENIIYGLKLAGVRDRLRLEEAVVRSLTQAALWDEVKDRLDTPAMAMSGGQQQRLCIARSLALEPEVLLLDAPTSGLDPISTDKVEESLLVLKQTYTIIVVPHSIQQAARIADRAAFFLDGALIEYRPGSELFTNPHESRTQDYVTGRFG